MARSMELKSIDAKLKQSQIAKLLGCSSSTLQRYRQDINMLSPYRNPLFNTSERKQNISNTNRDYDSQRERDVK